MKVISELQAAYPARKRQISELCSLFQKDEPFPDAVYVFGCTSTGKTSIVQSMLQKLRVKHVIIDLIECYSTKILLEKILNGLADHRVDPSNPQPFAKCEILMDFIFHLQTLAKGANFEQTIIVLDKAEQLRSMDANLLPTLMKLREMANIEISTILISELAFEKLYSFAQVEPLKVFFPQYSKEDLLEILTLDFETSRELVISNFSGAEFFSVEFYKSYLSMLLSVFYRTCRDLRELRYNAKLNLLPYCRPIIRNDCAPDDTMALWRCIAPILKASLEVLYLRIANKEQRALNLSYNETESTVPNLELPFYAKYLLIAAYLASYNSAKDDKRLFMKYHGKKRKSKKDMSQKNKVSERLNTQLGPKAFSLDRLMAIFYAILEEKVGFNHNLLVQVTTLVELQLLIQVSEGSIIDGQKYKCNVGYDFIQSVSKMVGFNIRKYLTDFN